MQMLYKKEVARDAMLQFVPNDNMEGYFNQPPIICTEISYIARAKGEIKQTTVTNCEKTEQVVDEAVEIENEDEVLNKIPEEWEIENILDFEKKLMQYGHFKILALDCILNDYVDWEIDEEQMIAEQEPDDWYEGDLNDVIV